MLKTPKAIYFEATATLSDARDAVVLCLKEKDVDEMFESKL